MRPGFCFCSRTSRPFAPAAALVLQTIQVAVSPEAENVVAVAHVPRIEVVGDGAANDLGAGHPLAAADVGQSPQLPIGRFIFFRASMPV